MMYIYRRISALTDIIYVLKLIDNTEISTIEQRFLRLKRTGKVELFIK